MLRGAARRSKKTSLAIVVRSSAGQEDLGYSLRTFLDVEASQQWPGKLVELGSNDPAEWILSVYVQTDLVEASVARFPEGERIHEKSYVEHLEPRSLAVRITTDAIRAIREKDFNPNLPRVSIASILCEDPHRRFFEFSDHIRSDLHRLLAEEKGLLLAERLAPSDLLREFELARKGLAGHMARQMTAPVSDILVYGKFTPRQEQALGSSAITVDVTLTVVSPTAVCTKQSLQLECTSEQSDVVSERARKLVLQAAAEARENLRVKGERTFSLAEFQTFKRQAFQLMPTPPLEEGVFYRKGSYRGPTQSAPAADLQRALHMLECAMLLRSDDTQVLVCTGAVLDGMARRLKGQDARAALLKRVSRELIERAYRLESNWNTRGMYWLFCMTADHFPPPMSSTVVSAARHIWNTRNDEPWWAHQISSALYRLCVAESDTDKVLAMLTQAVSEFEEKREGLELLRVNLSGYASHMEMEGDRRIEIDRVRGLADGLVSAESLFLQALGHMLHIRAWGHERREDENDAANAVFVRHYGSAVKMLPALRKRYGKKFEKSDFTERLHYYSALYEELTSKRPAAIGGADRMERQILTYIEDDNCNDLYLEGDLGSLLPLLRKQDRHKRALDLVTQVLEKYTVGGSGDYDQMWLARQRNQLLQDLGHDTPLRVSQLRRIAFDDDKNGWVTKMIRSQFGLVGVRTREHFRPGFRPGSLFYLTANTVPARIINHIRRVRDVACVGAVIGVGCEDGFRLLDKEGNERKHLTPDNSALPSKNVTLVCGDAQGFFVGLLGKKDLYAMVYRLDHDQGSIRNTNTRFFRHPHWQIKSDQSQAGDATVVPQTWERRTTMVDGKMTEFFCKDQGLQTAIKRVLVRRGKAETLLEYEGCELSHVFDWLHWQGVLLFATGNGLYIKSPGSDQVRCLVSEPDLLFLSLCPLNNSLILGTSDGLYDLPADLFRAALTGGGDE